MKEHCTNCKHCHITKELINEKWVYSYVCTLWLDLGEDMEPLLLTLGYDIHDKFHLCELHEFKS